MYEVGDIVKVNLKWYLLTEKQLQKRYKVIKTTITLTNSFVTIINFPKNGNYKVHVVPIQFVVYDCDYYRKLKLEKICSKLEM